MSQAGFVLDLHRCVGCGACVLACRIENGRTHAAAWRRVLPLNLARRPGGPTYSFSVACHHCVHPACLAGCPANAYDKRADGIVIHHDDRCIGCRYCEMTCPFGAPQFDADRGVVSKCHLCAHRVDAGREPACVVACPTGALQFTADVRESERRTGARAEPDVRGTPDGPDGSWSHPERVRACRGPESEKSAEGARPRDEGAFLRHVESERRTGPRTAPDVRDALGESRGSELHSTSLGTSQPAELVALVPGFVDPAGCAPNLRFRLPAGTRRAVLYRSLLEALTR